MVFGLPGQPGPPAQRSVVEEHRKGHDHAMQEFQVVEGKHVLEKAMRIRAAMNSAAVRQTFVQFKLIYKIRFSFFWRMEVLGILGPVFWL